MNTFTDYLSEQKPFAYMVKMDDTYRFFFRSMNRVYEILFKKTDDLGRHTLLKISDYKTALAHLSRFSEKERCFCLFVNIHVSTVVKTTAGYCSAIIDDGRVRLNSQRIYEDINQAARESIPLAPCFVPNILMPINTLSDFV